MDIATLGIAVDSRDARTAAGDLDKLTQAGTKTEASMAKTAAAAKKAAADVGSIGNSAKQAAFAMRQLPMQMTDIAVGLSTGQSPFYVLLQQDGQLKDAFGGIGPAARAVGGYVAGLINPFTLAAAAAAALAVAYKQGSDEQTAFAEAIITTGNAAGVSTQQLASMAAEIDDSVGTTRQAADALTQLVSTGRIYGDQLKELAQAAVAWEEATGIAVDDTVKQFAELAKDPVAASAKLNETYHYLTLSVYEQIKALQAQGREQEAAALAEKSYAETLESRAKEIKESLGLIESGWNSVKKGASEAWDAILGIGREATLDERIRKLNFLRNYANPQRRAEIDQELGDISARKELEEGNARMWADARQVQQQGIDAEKAIAKIRDKSLSNAEKREKALAEYRRNLEKVRAANPDSALLEPGRIARDEQNIRDKFKDTPGFDLTKELNKELGELDTAVMQSGDVMAQVAKDNEAYFQSIDKSISNARANVESIGEFLMTDEERLREAYERRQGMLDEAHDYGLISEEKYQQMRLDLIRKYEDDAEKLQAQKTSMMLQNSAALFDGLAALALTFSGKQSGIFKAMFAVSKAFAIADAIVKIQTGIANAAALPFPANLGAMATVAAATGSIVSTIQGTRLQGVAHGGMDNIPREGTWLLDGGERVVSPQQNRDLTSFLAKEGGSGGAPIVNLYEDRSRAGQVTSRNDNGQDVIDIFVADLMGDGRAQQAISRKFGMPGVGR